LTALPQKFGRLPLKKMVAIDHRPLIIGHLIICL